MISLNEEAFIFVRRVVNCQMEELMLNFPMSVVFYSPFYCKTLWSGFISHVLSSNLILILNT